ncbi:hypothetical protein [Streptomyces candidus]|uniref:Peptidoglycan binding domain-containing protein n=1 Tax=Streptomyces candidus TaxID=67283 RepID=A0A7X0LNW5_9ACTN|nr:hypothetical protein [Streptomyces candidus]MBB6435297.1 hypothetical protein [Streptomyces candidus]GHH40117.1 hypothetical protein GCM10018773_20670 [Streptomyces candidus]
MSRETDSSSSGAQGRGGTAYPSGTPPYGSSSPYASLPPDGRDGAGAEADDEPTAAVESDEPRTETTLTTRIRINIPGSRPIPPVVMRKPMNGADAEADGAPGEGPTTGETVWPPSEPLSNAPSAVAAGSAARSASSARPAPSARSGASGAPSSGSGHPPLPTRVQGATVRDNLGDGATGSASGSASGPVPGAGSAAGSGSGEETATSDWFAPRKAPVTPPPPPAAQSGTPGAGEPGGSRDDLPFFTDGSGVADAVGTGANGPHGPTGAAAPTGPTAGPALGSGTLGPMAPGTSSPSSAQGSGSGPWREVKPGRAGGGSPYGTEPPRPMAGANGAVGTTDDTAVLTPQTDPRDDLPGAGPGAPAPGPVAGPMTPPGYVSGDTLTSGVPVVQPEGPRTPFPGGPDLTPRLPGPPGAADFGHPEPVRNEPAPAPKPAAPAKKGRSKLVLLAVAAIVAAGGVYGAGLLLNHSDVPKGTTVLGVDIGGGTKDEAVVKLDAALGKRAVLPLQLSVDGKQTELAPANAGLTLDSQETVRGASGSDYNPVSVVGSLFGGERVAEPVIPVDEEKLTVALTSLAGTSGTASDGTIAFEPGKAVAVPGRTGKALDVKASMAKVQEAYRAQVASGKAVPIQLPVVAKEPTISKAELDRAMNEFAKPAMSDVITIQAGGKSIPFGPAKSLPKILSMKPSGGKLVPQYDLAALKELCDGAFDSVMITRADGTKSPVTMEDVREAMSKALVGTTQTERTRTIPLKES